MGFDSALAADALSVAFWALIVTSVVTGYLWLESWVEHLSFVRGWKQGATLGASILAAVYLDTKIHELRSASTGFQPGEATFMALWLFLGAAFLVGPFVLLFSPSNGKSTDQAAPAKKY